MNEPPQGGEDKTRRKARSRPKASEEEKSSLDRRGITDQDVEYIEERSSPRTPVIYEIVRRLGEEEMARPIVSLWWSGVAAGLSISFSLLAQAILETHLPDAPWRLLVSSFGYSVGFVMVVLSRQQLFTENTITVVLPVLAAPTLANLWKLARMWSVVLLANLAGTLGAALLCAYTPVLSPELFDGMIEISRHIMGHGWVEMFFKGVSSGFLMAAMVWMIPGAEAAQFHVVVLMTYVIAAGGFMHIVAGAVEAFLLLLHGDLGWWPLLAEFTLPVLAGNIVGGTALFGLIAYAQVMREI
jgi:formate/nitrite transporter FocA (FNT family)